MGILTPAMQAIVREQRLAYVATVGPDGRPNLSPRGTLVVWDDDHLMYADLRSPQSTANLVRNPAVEVNVVDPFLRKGYRFSGHAHAIADPAALERARGLLEPEVIDLAHRAHAYLLITVERAAPLISPGYDLGRSEEETVEVWLQYYTDLKRGRPTTRRQSD
ncbi:MAG: pyridoxamine 5'-phosphate oxidase family protein [Thermoplasmata archaeon]|nr:pyridoxamine 5'-phosphate oxidase family protein [Thermoplasmata archaeon]